jgi:hypothetical protein
MFALAKTRFCLSVTPRSRHDRIRRPTPRRLRTRESAVTNRDSKLISQSISRRESPRRFDGSPATIFRISNRDGRRLEIAVTPRRLNDLHFSNQSSDARIRAPLFAIPESPAAPKLCRNSTRAVVFLVRTSPRSLRSVPARSDLRHPARIKLFTPALPLRGSKLTHLRTAFKI